MGSWRGQRQEGTDQIERLYRPYFISGVLPAVVVLALSVSGLMVPPMHAISHETSTTNLGRMTTTLPLPQQASAKSSTNWTILQNIQTRSGPGAAIYDSLYRDIYVPFSALDKVSVIDPGNGTVLAYLPLGGNGGAQPQAGGVADPANGYVYVPVANGGAAPSFVDVISGSTHTVIANVTGLASNMQTPTYDPNNGIVYVANMGSDNWTAISGTGMVLKNSQPSVDGFSGLAGWPHTPTVDTTTGNIYVAGQYGIAVVSGDATNTFITNLSDRYGPHTPSFDPGNGDIYVPNSQNVTVIDGFTNRMVFNITVGSQGIPDVPLYDPANGYVYVPNFYSSNVSVINGASNKVVANIPVGGGPISPVLDPTTGDVIVSCQASYNISVISPTTDKVIATLAGNPAWASAPYAAAYDSANHDFYVSHLQSDNVTVIGQATPGPTISSFYASPNPVGVNKLTYLNVTATGGVGPLSYVYRGLPTGCTTSNTNALACTPTMPGNFSVRVYVNDTASGSANKVLALTVAASLPRITSVTVSPNPGSAPTGGIIFFNATPICSPNPCPAGTSYSWSLAPTSLGTLNRSSGASVSFTASATPHTGTLWVNGTLNTVTVSTSVPIQVRAPPSPTILSFGASPSFLTLGQGTVFTVQTLGGALLAHAASPLILSAALHYAYSGLPPGCVSLNASSLPCTPTAVGKFNVTVNVTDRFGRWALANTPLNVSSSVSGGNGGFSFLGFHGPAAYGAAAGVGGGVAVAGGGAFMMRGKLIRLRGGKGGSQVSSGGVSHQVSEGGVSHQVSEGGISHQVSEGGISHQVSEGGVSHGPAQGTPPVPPPTSPPSAP